MFLKNMLRIANHRQGKHIRGVSEAGYYLLLGPATLSPPLLSAHCPPSFSWIAARARTPGLPPGLCPGWMPPSPHLPLLAASGSPWVSRLVG